MLLQKIATYLNCARIFALPVTILPWFVIFVYSYINSGNVLYGLIALVGLCLAHLGANLLDDYFDYKFLIKQVNFDKEEYLKNSQKTKCRYLINGVMSEKELFILASKYFIAAFLVGLFLFFKCGIGVLYYGLAGAIVAVLYSFASRYCLAELMLFIAYGPAIFGGVYYVMCGTYSWNVFLLSLPTMFLDITLLYIHMVMDYEFDTNEGKKTIANRFSSPKKALVFLKWILIGAYSSLILLCIFDILDWQVLFVFLTIPLSTDLYKSLQEFCDNPESIPEHKWYHFPMENLDKLQKQNEVSFMIRMYQARNLMIYFSLIFVIAIVLSLAV